MASKYYSYISEDKDLIVVYEDGSYFILSDSKDNNNVTKGFGPLPPKAKLDEGNS